MINRQKKVYWNGAYYNALSKDVEFFKGTDLYDRTEKHRGKQYLSMTFFLEGLFSVYLTEKNL